MIVFAAPKFLVGIYPVTAIAVADPTKSLRPRSMGCYIRHNSRAVFDKSATLGFSDYPLYLQNLFQIM